MVSTSNSPGSASGAATPTNQKNGAAPLPADRKDALTVIQRDFRSDTITIPDEEMLRLMATASVGDDVYKQDIKTNQLQDKIAKLAGKEAALFCPTGTMTNQLAIRTHLHQPPYSVICDSRAHVHRYEAGGIAFHSQATTMAVIASNGRHITLDDILPNLILEPDIHFCPTRLICLENTLQGMVFPQEEIIRISDFAKEKGIAMHCDGARMWEVQAKTGKSLKELCAPFETVSLCMSKGLGAPIGSLLVGPKAFIEKAKWFRKLLGGGWRQSGGLAVAADFAMERTLPILPRVHALAAHLATSLEQLGVTLLFPTETNMVWIDTSALGFSVAELTRRALDNENGNKRIVLGGARIVLHFQISEQAVEDLIELVATMKDEAAKGMLKDSASAENGNASPYDVASLRKALAGKSMIKKSGENSIPYSGN